MRWKLVVHGISWIIAGTTKLRLDLVLRKHGAALGGIGLGRYRKKGAGVRN